jgi:FKBP-type peptidyl-prolyl cis-trans isomerase FkpA
MRLPLLTVSLLTMACAACATGSSGTTTAQAGAAPHARGVSGTARVTTASGIVFESVRNGSGPSPQATDTVTVNYRGTFPDGREFDSSYQRGQPASFPLNRVIPCWTEAVQMMKVGGKAHITCPSALAYGERGAGGVIPPNATLVFDIELLGIR